jgi:hypothetical protein
MTNIVLELLSLVEALDVALELLVTGHLRLQPLSVGRELLCDLTHLLAGRNKHIVPLSQAGITSRALRLPQELLRVHARELGDLVLGQERAIESIQTRQQQGKKSTDQRLPT